MTDRTRARRNRLVSGTAAAAVVVAGGCVMGPDASAAAGRPGKAAGKTYYVDSANGSDDRAGTTAATAWRTLEKVRGVKLNPGDTVALKRGSVWKGGLVLNATGDAKNQVRLTAYGTGDRPTIRGGDNCLTVKGAYWTIDALRVTDCDWAGFEIEGHHVTLDAIRADKNAAGVSITDNAHHNLVRSSEIYDNDKMVPGRDGPDDDAGAFGVLLNGDDNVIEYNAIAGSDAPSPDYGRDGAAVEIYDGDRNKVEHNIAHNNDTFTELGHQPGKTADRNVFAYNAVTSTLAGGSFLVTRGAEDSGLGPVTNTLVVNNSVWLSGAKSEGWSCYAGCGDDVLKLRNNAIKVGGQTGYEDGKGADENTGVYSGGSNKFKRGPESKFADPQFVSPTDLHLKAGSPAIGAGEPNGYDYDLDSNPVPSTGVSIGAYEYKKS